MTSGRSTGYGAAVVLALLLESCGASPGASHEVEVQILAFNDFHGALEAPTSGLPLVFPQAPEGPRSVESGGVARLATLVGQRRALHEHSIVVAAGDLIGASPLLSSRFHDEPTVQALSALGLALSAVGNHEFDEGMAELRRIQWGGCHPDTGCQAAAPYTGAGFRYLAANVLDQSSGEPVFPPFAIREFGGIRIGFIGLTLASTASLLIPAVRKELQFLDEAATINQQVVELRGQGVEAIVVLIHEGGDTVAGPDDCASLSGAITHILPQLDSAVDVVVSGHTHNAYNCDVDGVLLTSAGQYGTQLSDIALRIDSRTGDVLDASAETLTVARDELVEDPAIAKLVSSYRTLVEPLMQREITQVTAPLTRERNIAGESVMGDVVADAMLYAARLNTGEKVDIAFMNPGGLRAGVEVPGVVRFADLFAIQPFGNTLVLLSLSGADIERVLDQQFGNSGERILQVSEGFSYRWGRQSGKAGVVPGSITINGEPLRAERRYRLVTNNFVAEGGDGFTAFGAGLDSTPAGGDVEALEAWLSVRPSFTPPVPQRIGFDVAP